VLAALTVGAVAAGAWIGLRRLSGGGTVSPAPDWMVVLLAVALAAGSVRAAGSQLVSDLRHGPSVSEPLPRLPAAVIGYFRAHDQGRPVVLAESYIGYQLAGQADVYPVALPLERARGEARNHPTARRRAVNEALAPGVAPALRHRILDRYRASYVVINRATPPRAQRGLASDPRLQPLLESGSWVVYGVRRR